MWCVGKKTVQKQKKRPNAWSRQTRTVANRKGVNNNVEHIGTACAAASSPSRWRRDACARTPSWNGWVGGGEAVVSERGRERHGQFILEVPVLEREIGLDSLTPAALVVEVHVRALFELLRRDLGIVVTLEPLKEQSNKKKKKEDEQNEQSERAMRGAAIILLAQPPSRHPPINFSLLTVRKFLWYLQLCFLSSLAARYWCGVPCWK